MDNISTRLLSILLAVLSGPLALAGEGGKILAVFGEAATAKEPPPGWSFSWNAHGEIGGSEDYVPLSHDAKTGAYGVRNEHGVLQPDGPGSSANLDVVSARDREGTARFFIASYALGEDSTGDVWITNGNIQNKAFPDGTALKILVNHTLKFDATFPRDRFAQVFQCSLGPLKKNDIIHLAVGPAEKSAKGGGKLHFTIEELPAGQIPPEPANILSSPISGVDPQRGANGRIDPAYAAKHKAQREMMAAANPQLVLIGDSITARWPAEMLQKYFGQYSPANLGIGGDRIQNVLWRVQNGALEQTRPRVIVLLVGTNNLNSNNPCTPEEVAGGIGALLRCLQEKTPQSKILLLGILPRGTSASEPANENIRRANAKIALLADNQRIFFLDVGDRLIEPDGTILPEVMPDKIHVAEPGYSRWIEAMRPTLDKLLSE